MQCSLQELTHKLLKALDKENNVVDMQGVLAALAALEDYPVTKDSLEQTRIGKYVNEMRRKTKNKDLSRRAKNLVRKWKQLVDESVSSIEPVNGEGIVAKMAGGKISHLPPHVIQDSAFKPSSPSSRPTTPSSGKSTASPSLPSRSRPDTPGAAIHSPALSRPGTPSSVESLLSRSRKESSPHLSNKVNQHIHEHNKTNRREGTPTSGLHNNTSESLLKTNAANKKRRREKEKVLQSKRLHLSGDSPEEPENKTKTPKNGLITRLSIIGPDSPGNNDKLPSTPTSLNAGSSFKTISANTPSQNQNDKPRKPISRTPKVKTTAELIQEMQLESSEVSLKIANNQIEKEYDAQPTSIVPAGAKPRPRKTPGKVIPPNTSEKTLIQTKTEMMEKFLQNSYQINEDAFERTTPSPQKSDPPSRTQSPGFDQIDSQGEHVKQNNGSLDYRLDKIEHNEIDSPGPVTFFTDDNKMRRAGDILEESEDTSSNNPVIDPWSLLPPLLPESEMDWSEEQYVPPEGPVTDSDVERLHTQEWSGVNGQYNHDNQWFDWTSCYSVPTYKGDTLHILPYVDISDM